jgi:hypothetical protein
MKLKALIFYLFILITTISFAETSHTITDIEVIGLKRTNPMVVKNVLKSYLGQDTERVKPDEITALLLSMGIFENIEVSFSEKETQTILIINLEEKWSIIPLPIAAVTSDGYVLGAGLFDANAFGLNHKLFSSAIALPDGAMGSLGYIIDSLWQSRFGTAIALSYSKAESKPTDAFGNKLDEYGLIAFSTTSSLTYRLTPQFRWDLGLEYQHKESDSPKPIEELNTIGLRTGFSLKDKARWDGVFLTVSNTQIRYTWYFGLTGPSYGILSVDSTYEAAPFPGLKLSLRGASLWGPHTPLLAEASPGRVGLIILTDSYKTQNLGALRSGIELKLFKIGIATLAGLANYHVGYSESSRASPRFDYGPSFGLRLYIAKVALPALDLSFAYNQATNLARASFSLGMSM